MLQYCYLFNFLKKRVVENFLLYYPEKSRWDRSE